MDLSIIIVSYNTKEFLKKCVDSIFEHGKSLKIEIIVVDNNSTDGVVETIPGSKYPVSNFKLILNKENVGFSKANNIGIRQASGKYILFLNPDTEIRKNTLQKMVDFMDTYTSAGVATCRVELPSGELDDASHRGFPTPWNSFAHFTGISKIFSESTIFNGYNLGFKDLNKIHEIDSCAGAFMIARKKAGEEIGWWDEDYFFYGEDLDFCFELKEKGWKIYFVPSVSILHYKGVAGGIKDVSKKITTADEETKKRSQKARFDAMRIFYKKHYKKKYPSWITKLVMVGISMKEKTV